MDPLKGLNMSYTICLFEGSNRVNYEANEIIDNGSTTITFKQSNGTLVTSNCKYVIEALPEEPEPEDEKEANVLEKLRKL